MRPILVLAVLACLIWPSPGRAAPHESVEAWQGALAAAGAAADYAEAAEVVLAAPLFSDRTRAALVDRLRRSFAGAPFAVDAIAAITPAERGQRRLLALWSEDRYLYLFVVLHRRPEGWTVIHFNANASYAEIANRM